MRTRDALSGALFYEDFEPGLVHETPARTVTEADVVGFAGLSGDFNPMHTDAEFAGASPFGERIAHGLLGLAITSGLLARLSLFDGTGLAFLGLSWEFKGPIRFGDTLRVRQIVIERRETSDPSRGIVDFSVEVINQHDAVIQTGTRRLMIACRQGSVQ